MPKFSETLETAFRQALSSADERRHCYATLEHLLLALLDEPTASKVLTECAANLDDLRETLLNYVNNELQNLTEGYDGEAKPTSGFQRVVQRGVIHVTSGGKEIVEGENVVVAIFAERESHAAFFLQEQGVTRYDAVNYISHGINKIESKKSYSEDFVFISYSGADRTYAEIVRHYLKKQGIQCRWDQDIQAGTAWRHEIAEQLRKSKAVLTLWSRNSINSAAVVEEASRAQAMGKLFHIKIDDCEIPYGFSETQYRSVDFLSLNYENKLSSLFKDIKSRTENQTKGNIRKLLVATGSVAAIEKNGKIAVVDSPAGVGPPVRNPKDLTERIRAQQDLSQYLSEILSPSNCNLPRAVQSCVERYLKALNWNKICWYALDDAMSSVNHCLSAYREESWPGTSHYDLINLNRRHKELEPLLRPKQKQESKNKEPLINFATATDKNIQEIISGADSLLNSDDTNAVLDESAAKAISHYSEMLKKI